MFVWNLNYIGTDKYPREIKMKIVLISARHSSLTACEHYIYKALIGMGHEIVADLDFRIGATTINQDIPEDADLLLAWKGSTLDPEVIKNLKYPTVLWYPDFWEMVWTQKDILRFGRAFDYLYTPIMKDAAYYKRLGYNAYYLAPGVDCDTFHKIDIEVKSDIGMIGATYDDRERLCKQLHDAGMTANIFFNSNHYNMNQLHNTLRIVFNQGIVPGHGAQLRIFEAMATGTMLLNIKCPEIDAIFEDGKHLAIFENGNIVEKARYYLEHSEERERIAECGMREVQANHAWEKRLQVIFDNLN